MKENKEKKILNADEISKLINGYRNNAVRRIDNHKYEILLSDIKDYAIIPLGSFDNFWNASCFVSHKSSLEKSDVQMRFLAREFLTLRF